MEKKEFLESIRASRRKLNIRDFLNKLVFALGVGALAGILFQGMAFLIPVYYVNLYTLLALLLAGLTAFIMAFLKRSSMKQAALVMDSFGFQERIITAYEHLEKEEGIFLLQREDAMRRLAANKERIKIPVLPDWRRMTGLLGLFLVLMILAILPSPMKERAKELQKIDKVATEKVEELEEVVEALEELQQENLTPEQLAALQEMVESLQASMEEYHQANSAQGLTMAGEKLEYKYEEISSQLSELAKALQNGATASALTAEAMQELASNLQDMSGTQLASGDGQNDDGQGSDQNGGDSNGDSQGSGQNGDSQDGNQQGDGQSGNQGGDGQGNGQGGNQNGNGGAGQNGGSGNGGNGDGQGGNGNGGNGNGSGSGRGTGSSSTPHDYVSVPNAIANSGNLSGEATNHDASDYFKTQNGLSWEGERISYESVIGSYEQNAYEGIAAKRYPSGMEDVIKEYFSSFN